MVRLMKPFSLRDDVEGSEPEPLFGGELLLKSVQETPEGNWKFAAIASDESSDIEGDQILRKSIDLSYAKERGYVNWDHSRQPADQLGFLTKAIIISDGQVEELKKSFPEVASTASVYVEGELYKTVPKNSEIVNLMKSASTTNKALGVSLDGALARDVNTRECVKAFVRGIAITPQPAHPRTLFQLRKSIDFYSHLKGAGSSIEDLANLVVEGLSDRLDTRRLELAKSVNPGRLDRESAIQWVLKTRPEWSVELATKLVDFTLQS